MLQRIDWGMVIMATMAERENLIKTRSVSRKIKEEKKAAREKKKLEMEEEEKRAEIRKGKRKNDDDDDEEKWVSKKARSANFVPMDGEVSDNDTSGRNKRTRGADDLGESSNKKSKLTHEDDDLNSLYSDSDSDSDSDCDSIFGGEHGPDDPINTLPDLGDEAPSLPVMPQEVLERIVDECDPVTRTLLGLTNKRFGHLAMTNGAGFPSISNRYGGDVERHRFMSLLEPWMNRAYTEAPEPVTVAEQKEREKLKKLRLC